MDSRQLDLMSWTPPKESTERLRPYQHEAVTTCLEALAAGHSPVLMLPTGSGKSRVIAALCEVIPERILVATHRQELLEQNAAQLCAYMENPADYGLYSAGLGRRETANRVVFGGIQSIYRQMDRLQQAGAFQTVIVDECTPGTASLHPIDVREGVCAPALRPSGSGSRPHRTGSMMGCSSIRRWTIPGLTRCPCRWGSAISPQPGSPHWQAC